MRPRAKVFRVKGFGEKGERSVMTRAKGWGGGERSTPRDKAEAKHSQKLKIKYSLKERVRN